MNDKLSKKDRGALQKLADQLQNIHRFLYEEFDEDSADALGQLLAKKAECERQAKRIARRYGAQVRFDSDPDQGCPVVLVLNGTSFFFQSR